MAVGLSAAMTTAKSSLLATQEALAITSNNISNAGNTSYHKQSVNLADNVEILDLTGYYGTGVSVASITRAYSTALESSLASANTTDGYNQAYLDYSSQVEDLVAPDGESTLIDSMGSFMDSIQDVQSNPEDETYRDELITAAGTLADTLNSTYSSLKTINTGLAYSSGATSAVTTNEIADEGTTADAVTEVNSILSQLVELNDRISNLETYNSNHSAANDLRDQRDSLVKDLAGYVGITVTEDTYGRYTITTTTGDGTAAVTLLGVSGTGTSNYESYANVVQAEFTPIFDTSTIPPTKTNYSALDFYVYSDSNGDGTLDIATAMDNTGELGGYADSYNYITNEMKQIYNEDLTYVAPTMTGDPGYAQAIAYYVNQQLALGSDLHGVAGAAMFELVTGPFSTTGSVLNVTDITYDEIAASGVAPASPQENGNGDNMGTLWNLLNTTKVEVYATTNFSTGATTAENKTLGGYANSYVNAIATQVANATTSASTSSATVTMYKNAIAGKSGVSSDEELTNMLALQNAYAASAKVINTIQSMYDAIFSVV